MVAGSGWRLTGQLRRSRVGRWWRARQGRRGRGSRVAPSIAAAKASFSRPQIKPGGQSQPKPNPTPTRLDLHDSGQNALSLTSPHLHCSQPLCPFVISLFSTHRSPTGVIAASTAISPPDLHAVELGAALRGATGKPDNETARESP